MTIIPVEGAPLTMPISEGIVLQFGEHDFRAFLNEKWRKVEYVGGVWLIVDNVD